MAATEMLIDKSGNGDWSLGARALSEQYFGVAVTWGDCGSELVEVCNPGFEPRHSLSLLLGFKISFGTPEG